MSIDVLNKGETRYIEGIFLNQDEEDADPDTVTLKIIKPSGVVIEEIYEGVPSAIERTAEGRFRRPTEFDQPGDWRWQWIATGDVQDVEPAQCVVVGNGF